MDQRVFWIESQRFAKALVQVVAMDIEAKSSVDAVCSDGQRETMEARAGCLPISGVTALLLEQGSDEVALQLTQRGQGTSP